MSLLLSVITVNRNNRSGLKLTAESVSAQDLEDCEWLIVDGDSTDGSQEIFGQYRSFISFCVSEKDFGIYEAMNKGVAHCCGEYCLFLNSGDRFHSSGALKNCKDRIRNSGADIIRFAEAWTVSGKICHTAYPPEKVTGIYLFENSIAHQSTVIRTSLLQKYPYRTDFRSASDHDFFTRVFLYENIRDLVCRDVLSDFDCSGLSNTKPWIGTEECRQSFISLTSPVIYADYKRFCCGGNLLEKWICKFRRTPAYYWTAVVLLSPLYLFNCVRSLVCHLPFFCRKIMLFFRKTSAAGIFRRRKE